MRPVNCPMKKPIVSTVSTRASTMARMSRSRNQTKPIPYHFSIAESSYAHFDRA